MAAFSKKIKRHYRPLATITDRFHGFRKYFETSNGRLPLEDGSDRRETLPKRVSGDSRRFIFRRQKKFFSQTLNGRLSPEDGSDWPETWPKRVSGDPRHFIF